MLLLLFIGWYIGLPLYRAYNRDIKSWGVAAAPVSSGLPVAIASATATAGPTATAQPTATQRPSETPQPTATATTTPTITPTPTPVLPAAQPMTILLLGLDARPGEGMRARSDALMLVHIDPQRGDVGVLSMPRDLWINIPGYGESKVNAAFYQGEIAQPNGGGIAAAKQTLSSAYNLPIDYGVVIDFAGFRSLIDALGGITVDVPKEIYDGQFPTEDYGYTVAHFLPGPQQMDGATALMYARTRHPDSDFERIKRQQLVMLGIAAKIRERGALQNLHEADQLTAALTPYIHTDMPPDLVLSMLWNMREIEPARVRRYTVDGSMLWETSVNGAYALVPQQGVLPALGQKLLSDPVP
ncbi:MAG TPA: LCP family protein [Herpetosiphonaceae bacterium]